MTVINSMLYSQVLNARSSSDHYKVDILIISNLFLLDFGTKETLYCGHTCILKLKKIFNSVYYYNTLIVCKHIRRRVF